ncbi:MAG TPA: PKD domain-containing protein [Dokdonella sp.]|nr:PKD domain-containing protein [Dokdonella sp.]
MNRLSSTRDRSTPLRRSVPMLLQPLLFGLLAVGTAAQAIQPVESANEAPRLRHAFVAPELQVQPELEATTTLGAKAGRHVEASDFARRNPGAWEMRWDRRADRPDLVQGAGVPLVPGGGNALTLASLGLRASEHVDMAVVETRLLDFIAANHALLKTDGLEFQLDEKSSTAYGKGDSHWFVEFAQSKDGVRVQGANLFFRISHGNIVQFGSHLVAPVAIDTQPVSSREKAFELAFAELDFTTGTRVREMLEPGELLLLPYAADGKGAGEGFSGADGTGYAHRLAWRYVFRVAGDRVTYEVMVDAKSNRVIEVRDLNDYVDATVDGGIYATGVNTGPETIVAMPFAAVSNGGAKVTDALGIYDYSGGTATTALDGKYFRMVDSCGSISLSNSSDGNLHLGTDTSTDCGAAGGAGGNGNTRASRNGFYYLTKINRKASGFLPGNSWIASKVTANMNVNDVCNAYWDGSSLNFFKSGSGCSNTGELAAVFLHEWGHGMDTNSGGAASEYGTGEAVGDSFAFLETKDGCIGNNFRPGVPCANCSSSCTGVRDVNAFSTHGAAVISKPSNVTNNSGINCDQYIGQGGVACPYIHPTAGVPYQGPMGYEGHCESYIASSANWDLAQALVAQYGSTQGWAEMDRIWYGSLTPSKSAYQVASGGKCNASATVNGCGSNNWYTVYLAADDDDGNLANGTPNACRIWDAFNAHGIACGTRPACSTGGGNVPPVANFGATTNGLTANFTDSSTDSDGSIASRSWTFGDGGTSTATNPSHTYASAGTYSVSLTVTDNGGATNTRTSSVTVSSGSNVPPVANFTFSTSGLTASFTDSSTDSDGTIASRAWTFGDGGTSTATSPSHTYASAGTYSVALTVTDNGGATNTKTSSVTVNASGATVLQNGVPVTGLSAATGVDKLFTLAVPAGATNLRFVTSGGSGDADLYVKFGSAPTTSVNDCKSEGSTTAETCNIGTAQAGTYYVLVHAWASYSGVSLTGSYSTGGGTQTYSNTTDYPIADYATVDSPIAVSGRSGNAPSNASVTVAIVHTYIGDLKVDLVAPDGSLYNIHNRTGAGTDNINKTVTLNLSGEALNGTWKLRVNDNAGQDTGYIDSWSITF